MVYPINQIRTEFPLLGRRSEIAYLDNAATTQKPYYVLDAVRKYYEQTNSNVHRAAHQLSEESTEEFEKARSVVAKRLNAKAACEVIWTKGTTEAINLVAYSLSNALLGDSSEVLITEMEHHSNIVPWQMACQRTGACLRVARVTSDGTLDMEHFEELLCEKTKIVAVTHVSNVLGTINPVAAIINSAHKVNALVVLDGAQAVAHDLVDVQELNCDFYAFSGHKIYGPTGIGVLYGKEAILESLPPWQGGGEMIEEVKFEKTTYQGLPFRFEAGTPNIAGAVGMRAAVEYLNRLDHKQVREYERSLLYYATAGLRQVEGVRIVGTADEKGPVISFVMDDAHPQDIATLLDQQKVAVRAGHHCAMPLMRVLGLTGTVRASIALYNSKDEVNQLITGLHKVRELI